MPRFNFNYQIRYLLEIKKISRLRAYKETAYILAAGIKKKKRPKHFCLGRLAKFEFADKFISKEV